MLKTMKAARMYAKPVDLHMSILDLFLLSSIFVKILMIGLFLASVWSWGFTFMKIKELNHLSKICDALEHISDKSQSWKVFFNAGIGLRDDFVNDLHIEINNILNSKNNEFQKSELALDSLIEKKISETKSGLAYLASIGSISPFIGLLGTVWGIMSSFRSMLDDMSGIAAVAPGIAESLLATAIGLIVAIPATLCYNYFVTKFDNIDTRLYAISRKILILIDIKKE